MPSFNVAAHASGSAFNTAATATIAAGSNISAVVSVVYEDLTHTGITCSQGGATVSSGSATSLVRNEVIYRVIGLSAGSVTFTGTGSGSGSINIVALVFSDAVQDLSTGFGTIASAYETLGSPSTLAVATTDADDLVASFLWSGGGAGGPATAGSGTLRATTGPAGYGHYEYGATFTRTGATTTTDWTWSGINPYVAGVAVKHEGGGGGGEPVTGELTNSHAFESPRPTLLSALFGDFTAGFAFEGSTSASTSENITGEMSWGRVWEPDVLDVYISAFSTFERGHELTATVGSILAEAISATFSWGADLTANATTSVSEAITALLSWGADFSSSPPTSFVALGATLEYGAIFLGTVSGVPIIISSGEDLIRTGAAFVQTGLNFVRDVIRDTLRRY
jgi:hypothetical protein